MDVYKKTLAILVRSFLIILLVMLVIWAMGSAVGAAFWFVKVFMAGFNQ